MTKERTRSDPGYYPGTSSYFNFLFYPRKHSLLLRRRANQEKEIHHGDNPIFWHKSSPWVGCHGSTAAGLFFIERRKKKNSQKRKFAGPPTGRKRRVICD